MPSTRFLPARRAVSAVVVALLFPAWVSPALGQIRLVGGSNVFSEGQRGNLFAQWNGPERLAESILRLPVGWKLVEAAGLQRGHRIGVSWTAEDEDTSYRLTPLDPGEGPLRLILKVEAPDYASGGFWSITPGIARASDEAPELSTALALREELITEPVRVDEDNQAAVFNGRTRIELKGGRLPVFEGDRSYTIELWLKTTGLGEILLSTWNGDEEVGYPIELVVAADGQVQYFRGEPGRHLSMSSLRPVADGRWHHVAVVHDEVRGWTRLLVDSVPTDSLTGHTDAGSVASFGRLCLGGRCESGSVSPGRRSVGYVGWLDQVRVWPTARTTRQIASSMGEEIPPVAGMIALSFDRPLPRDLSSSDASVATEPSDFLFFDPVEDLSASVDAGTVLIEWESGGRNTGAFIVERSADGSGFEEVGRVARTRTTTYTFSDASVLSDVVYYRIQQVLSNGGVRSSGTLKVGLGHEELPSAIGSLLVGNFPNPFSSQTTVRFQMTETQRVSVSVWDLSGHQVVLLTDGIAGPGMHEVLFQAGDLPSGTYFVRLQTDEGVSTKPLTLTR